MTDALLVRYYQRYINARLYALILVSLGAFLVPLAISASLVAVPSISVDLNANALLVSWIPAAFVLSSLIAQLPGGRIADLHGRKWAFILGFALFALGGLLSGMAPTIEVLLLARIVQGVGGAIGTSAGMAILSSIYQAKGRGAALGWMTSSVYIGMSSGPLIGGWLVEQWGWRAVFWGPVPITLMLVLFSWQLVKGEWRSPDRHLVDWPGVAILALALSGLFFGTTQLTHLFGLGFTVIGLVFSYLFLARSKRVSFPLVRVDLVIQNRTFLRSLSAAMCMYASQYGIVFLMALYLQYNRGMSATEAGQMLMLQAIMMAFCAPLAGRLSDLWGSRVLATLGCLLIAIGLGVLLRIDTHMPTYMIAGGMMIIGLGHGLFSTPNNSTAVGTITSGKLGIATAILSLARQGGQLIGTAVLSLLLAIYFDGRAITPEGYSDLQSVAHWALSISLLLALLAAWFSSRPN